MGGTSLSLALSLLSCAISIISVQPIGAAEAPEGGDVNFLELGTQFAPADIVKSKCPSNVPSWECDAPPVAPTKATMPPMPEAGPKVPRSVKCTLVCRYGGTFNFNSTLKKMGGMGPSLLDDEGSPNPRDVQTLFVDTAHKNKFGSFMEIGPVGPGDDPAPAATKDKKTSSLSNPFSCKTKCQFPRSPTCNPIYNFRLGPMGMRPDEKECCQQCDRLCNKRQILWQFRVCVHGCRAFCPFKVGHWSEWET